MISYPYIPESKSSHLAKYKYFKDKDPKEKVNFTTVKTKDMYGRMYQGQSETYRVKTCLEECTCSSLEPTYRVKTCMWKNVPGEHKQL